tara:strand:+ start:929 stop:1270 length:342 start_codon:yes stop_codon:yes gene_type:complete
MARKRSLRKTRRRVRKGGMKMNMMSEEDPSQLPQIKQDTTEDMEGGKKRKTMKKGGKKRKKRKGTKGKKMNEFFKLLIDAKKKNADSFVYKGKTYKKKVGTKKNPKLVVYKKA